MRGQASVSINDQEDVTIQIIGSDPGALTVQIQNKHLPKLPLVGFPETPPMVNAVVAPLVETNAPKVWQALQQAQQEASQQPSTPAILKPRRENSAEYIECERQLCSETSHSSARIDSLVNGCY